MHILCIQYAKLKNCQELIIADPFGQTDRTISKSNQNSVQLRTYQNQDSVYNKGKHVLPVPFQWNDGMAATFVGNIVDGMMALDIFVLQSSSYATDATVQLSTSD